MLVQRKLLTTEQKNDICDKYYNNGKGCDVCPLRTRILGKYFCIYNLNHVQYAIDNYFNEEIEV